MLEPDLFEYIQTQVSGLKCWAEHAPQGTGYPYLQYSIDSTEYLNNTNGYAGLATRTYTFDIVSDTFSDVMTKAESIRTSLQGFRGRIGSTDIIRAFVVDLATDAEPKGNSGDVWVYWATQTWTIQYRESIPTYA